MTAGAGGRGQLDVLDAVWDAGASGQAGEGPPLRGIAGLQVAGQLVLV